MFLADLWKYLGDFLYDQPLLMQEAGLEVTVFEEFGPGKHIRAIVGLKPGPRGTFDSQLRAIWN
jgi:hypothetical protein